MEFHHPYTPYDIQIQLMEQIYKAITGEYKVGIFESPTGTGKTLSIICSTMTWLRTHKKDLLKQENENSGDEPDWVKEYSGISSLATMANQYEDDLKSTANKYEHIFTSKHDLAPQRENNTGKRKANFSGLRSVKKINVQVDDTEFLPADYIESSSESHSLEQKNEGLQTEIRNMLRSFRENQEAILKNDSAAKFFDELCSLLDGSKIYFTSRTHSQLAQFADQLRMPKFPPSLADSEAVKYLPVGSRKQLCINPKVSRLESAVLINEACLDLQTSNDKKNKDTSKDRGQKPSSGCSYYKNFTEDVKAGANKVSKVRDLTFSKVHDIEDIAAIGHEFEVCPYYSTVRSLDQYSISEVISLPYQMLLDPSIRSQLGLDLKNSVVVVDEAHNLIDTIISLNSEKILLDELLQIRENLQKYFKKFAKKLNAGNRVNLMKLQRLLSSLINFVEGYEKKHGKIQNGLEITVNEMFSNGGDLINIHSLEQYLKKSKIAYKIESYSNVNGSETTHKSSPLLFKLTKFLKLISNPSSEGKVFFDTNPLTLNYMLLDPVEVFRDIVDQCKCVLLCGGTMQPTSDFQRFLFPYLRPSEMLVFSCDHIIPNQNLCVIPLGKGRCKYDFSFGNRSNNGMIEQLGRDVVDIVTKVPHGVVMFIPSYKYLDQLIEIWRNCDVWKKLHKAKSLFVEPKNSSDVDKMLTDYADCNSTTKNGAMLLSVVGGKVSEGINFSDDLARAVILIGLPYPNVFSGEIINRRIYIEQSVIKRGGTQKEAKMKSLEFYENLCMKAVNQSVGRAIRNKDDYAMIYLVDHRYETERVQNKLSGWVKKAITSANGIEQCSKLTTEFFKKFK